MLDENNVLPRGYETDQSSTSDDDSIRISQLSKRTRCLVCSMLPALSNINCCQKHLTLLIKTFSFELPTKTHSMMPSTYEHDSEVECCSKNRQRLRSRSTSISNDQPQRKRKRMKIQLLNTTFRKESISSSDLQSNQMSSSSSTRNTTMNKNNSRQQNRIPIRASILTRNKQGKISRRQLTTENKSIQTNSRSMIDKSTVPELIELEPELSYTPCLLLKRIVHIKDEEYPITDSRITFNVNRTADSMTNQCKTRPKILLKRACLDKV